MNKTKLFLFFLLAVFQFSMAQNNKELKEWANQGQTKETDFFAEIPFHYVDHYIILDIEQNDKTYQFMFDTGAEASVIDTAVLEEFETISEGNADVFGPVINNGKVNYVSIKNIVIGGIHFENTGAIGMDMGFSEKVFAEKLDGIIGSSLIKKAVWQIDYKKKLLRIANNIEKFELDENTEKINMHLKESGWGTENVALAIEDEEFQFAFDTGNGRRKFVANPEDLKKVLRNHKKSRLELNLKDQPTDYRFIANTVKIGDMILENQVIDAENEVGTSKLIGNRFLEDYLVTVDFKNHHLFLKKNRSTPNDEIAQFELIFKPNYQSKKLEVYNAEKDFNKKHKIEKGAVVQSINEKDLSGLTKEALLNFWQNEWLSLQKQNSLDLVLSQNGKKVNLKIHKIDINS